MMVNISYIMEGSSTRHNILGSNIMMKYAGSVRDERAQIKLKMSYCQSKYKPCGLKDAVPSPSSAINLLSVSKHLVKILEAVVNKTHVPAVRGEF